MPDFKSKLTSKKLVIAKWHSTVKFNPFYLNSLHNFFFIFSESGPEMFWKHERSLSLYKLMLFFPNSLVNRLRRKSPTKSHMSAPSQLPIVTWKSELSFLTQTLVLSNKIYLWAWKSVSMTSSSKVIIDLA